MKQETDMKMMEILRILYSKNEILGAKVISEELKKRGYSLGERAVRYHMHILDEKEFTEKVGYKGRKITKKGIDELKKGLIYDQVDFTFSRFQEKMYNVSLEPRTAKGSVIVNISSIKDKDSLKTIHDIFEKGLAVSDHYQCIEREGKKYIATVCGTTIDGVFQQKGIISQPLYGGLLKIEDNTPIKFIEQISYTKTSITPLEAFTGHGTTSVLDVISTGDGVIPANFRVIPEVKKDEAIKVIKSLEKIGIGGVIHIGNPGEPVLGIPVEDKMIGIVVIGGVTPLCAAQEEGYNLDVKLADSYAEYSQMVSPNKYNPNLPFKPVVNDNSKNVTFLMNKVYNLISQVNYDIDKEEGNVITNISYISKDDLDEAIEILNKVYKSIPEYCMGNKYSLIKASDNRVGIATLCSLTIDGILTNNGINSSPKYSGVLDVYGNNRRFIDLISYQGSSIDPHEIFIKKDMQNIEGSLENAGRILASVHTVPYISRDETVSIFELLKDSGFEALHIGKPNEYTFNARIEKYNFGYVLAGGLNPIAAIVEQGIPAEVKALETIMDFNLFEEL